MRGFWGPPVGGEDPAGAYPIPLYSSNVRPEDLEEAKYDTYCSNWGCFSGLGPVPLFSFRRLWQDDTYLSPGYVSAAPLTMGRAGSWQPQALCPSHACTMMPSEPLAAPPWLGY